MLLVYVRIRIFLKTARACVWALLVLTDLGKFDLSLCYTGVVVDQDVSNRNPLNPKQYPPHSIKALHQSQTHALILPQQRATMASPAPTHQPPAPRPLFACCLLLSQVKILPRTSAGHEFHRLLASADVILHPFPFGGSKTSADGLALGK